MAKDWWMAVVTPDRPGYGSAHPNAPIYAVKEVYCSNSSGDSDDGITWAKVTNGRHEMAENTGENTNSHLLNETDTPADADAVIVKVSRVRDRQSIRVPKFFFRRRPRPAWTEIAHTVTVTTGASAYTQEFAADNSLVGETRYLYKFPNAPVKFSSLFMWRFGPTYLKARCDWGNGDSPPGAVIAHFEAALATANFSGATTWATQPAYDQATYIPAADIQASGDGFEDPATGADYLQCWDSAQGHYMLHAGVPTAETDDVYGIVLLVGYLLPEWCERHAIIVNAPPLVHVIWR